MMHVFRLLDMAGEIATGKGVIVRRPNRDFLLSIRKGDFEYEELVKQAAALGYKEIAITDRNSFAGIVRGHIAAKKKAFGLFRVAVLICWMVQAFLLFLLTGMGGRSLPI